MKNKTSPWVIWNKEGIHWFLFAMVVWRMSLPLILRLKFPTTTTLILSMMMQISDTGNAFVHSTFSYLPFFVIGYRTSPGTLRKFRRPSVRLAFCCIVLTTILVSFTGQGEDKTGDEHVSFSMKLAAVVEKTGTCMLNPTLDSVKGTCHQGFGFIRPFAFYLASLMMMHGFLACVPTGICGYWVPCLPKWPVITTCGLMSLHIYLLHIFFSLTGVSMVFNVLGKDEQFQSCMHAIDKHGLLVPFTILIAIVVWLMLSLPCVRVIFRPLLEPKCGCCILREDDTSVGRMPTVRLETLASATALPCWGTRD